mmetsp:Transcript_39281/g.87913  ORF Transcript_39281/g.87913 Transcript_39281/m.87913 type:complete len:258 (+) Transcript_39281:2-775(+)
MLVEGSLTPSEGAPFFEIHRLLSGHNHRCASDGLSLFLRLQVALLVYSNLLLGFGGRLECLPLPAKGSGLQDILNQKLQPFAEYATSVTAGLVLEFLHTSADPMYDSLARFRLFQSVANRYKEFTSALQDVLLWDTVLVREVIHDACNDPGRQQVPQVQLTNQEHQCQVLLLARGFRVFLLYDVHLCHFLRRDLHGLRHSLELILADVQQRAAERHRLSFAVLSWELRHLMLKVVHEVGIGLTIVRLCKSLSKNLAY